MNKIKGNIKKININGLVSQIDIDCFGEVIKVLILQVPTLFKEKDPIELFVKESEILLAKRSDDMINKNTISIQNILNGKVSSIKNGDIFTEVAVSTSVGQMIVITETESFKRLDIIISSPVCLLIKANSIGLGATG